MGEKNDLQVIVKAKELAVYTFKITSKLVKEGKIDKEKFNDSFNSWKNHTPHGNCFNLVKNLETKVNAIIQ